MDLADQLQKLQTLREQGVLTEVEFALAKKRVLDGSGSERPKMAMKPCAASPRTSPT